MLDWNYHLFFVVAPKEEKWEKKEEEAGLQVDHSDEIEEMEVILNLTHEWMNSFVKYLDRTVT